MVGGDPRKPTGDWVHLAQTLEPGQGGGPPTLTRGRFVRLRGKLMVAHHLQFLYAGHLLALTIIAATTGALVTGYLCLFAFHPSVTKPGMWDMALVGRLILLTTLLILFVLWRGMVLSQRIAAPLAELAEALEWASRGEFNVRLAADRRGPFAPVQRKFNELMETLEARGEAGGFAAGTPTLAELFDRLLDQVPPQHLGAYRVLRRSLLHEGRASVDRKE